MLILNAPSSGLCLVSPPSMRFNLLLFLFLPSLISAQRFWKPLEQFQNDLEREAYLERIQDLKNTKLACEDSMVFYFNNRELRSIEAIITGLDTVVTESTVLSTIDSNHCIIDSVVIPHSYSIFLDSMFIGDRYGAVDSLSTSYLHPDYGQLDSIEFDIDTLYFATFPEWSHYFLAVEDTHKLYFHERRTYSYQNIFKTIKEIETAATQQGLRIGGTSISCFPDGWWVDYFREPELIPKEFLDQADYIRIDVFLKKGEASLNYTVLFVNEH